MSRRIIILVIVINEETTYCFIKPLCVVWLVCEALVNMVPAPCAPICSCHPRSKVREERNREDVKEDKIEREWKMST